MVACDALSLMLPFTVGLAGSLPSAVTVTSQHWINSPFSVNTIITTSPAAFAVIIPVSSIVAMLLFREINLTPLFVAFAGVTVALNL